MISLGAFQRCVTLVLLSVALLSFFTGTGSELSSKRVKRPEGQANDTDPRSGKARNHSCVRANRPANRTLRRHRCHPYIAHTRKDKKAGKSHPEVCRSILGDELLYATPAEQIWRENLFVTYSVRFRGGFMKVPDLSEAPPLFRSCWWLIVHMYCKFLLPKCDLTSSTPLPQPICREACEKFINQCQKKWTDVLRMYKVKYNLMVSWVVQRVVSGMQNSKRLMWCRDLPKRNGPNVPECYYPEMLKDKANLTGNKTADLTEKCFYGDGQLYRGNMSMTKSGYTCQSWSSQCPHRHYRTPSTFPELKSAGNTCRNPGGQAPNGPWCYTTNRKVRWEYCRVDKCKTQEENEN